MEPLVVRLRLVTPIAVPSYDRAFDALLSWAKVRLAEEAGEEDPISHQHDLPLERHECGGQWCFKASNMLHDWSGDRYMTHRVKKQSLDDYTKRWQDGVIRKRPVLDLQRGSTKAGLYEIAMRQCDIATAWCIGDRKGIEILLARLTHYGKLASRGAGRIVSFVVERDDTAIDRWKQRVLPAESEFAKDDSRYATTVSTLQAPYWDYKKSGVVRMPIVIPA